MSRGRPPKLSDELQRQIVAALRAGNTIEVAAQAAGVGRSTLYGWLARGEAAETGRHRAFANACEQARAEAEVLLVGRMATAARNGSWGAAGWLLERRYPERWTKDREVLPPPPPAAELTEEEAAFAAVDELAARRGA